MQTVRVNASKQYEIKIGAGLLGQAGPLAAGVFKTAKCALITDDHVDPLYSDILTDSLEQSGFAVQKKVFPNGESVKTPENAFEIINFLAENRFTRTDAVFALGGGTIGDLAGFAASVFLRGVKLVQIPTTLLAAVDSSVGGKTAVNLKTGKNLAGSFYQPDLVICDTEIIKGLPDKIFFDGCAEVIKYGVIASESLFDTLQNGIKDNLEAVITECVSIKRDIVESDERDTGLRQLLNFGHTAAHAIEKRSRYESSHGEAVAAGMVIAASAGEKMGICGPEVKERLIKVLTKYSLPVKTHFSAGDLTESALSDKKRSGGEITLVIPQRIGKAVLKKIPIDELKTFFEYGLNN